VIPLDAADIVLVAAALLQVEPSEVLRRIDLDAVDQALAEPVPPPADPAARTAALVRGLQSHRPLPVRNNQLALLAATQFLAVNGWRLDGEPPEELARVLRAPGTTKRLARWLRPRLLPTETRRNAMIRLSRNVRHVLDLAQEEARLLRHHLTLPHHLLLGLIREEGAAATALATLGVDLGMARLAVAEVTGQGPETPHGIIILAPRARQALDLSAGEARRLGSSVVDTEHLLLGLVRQTDAEAARVLDRLDIRPEEVREQVLQLAGADGAAAEDRVAALRAAMDAAIDAGDFDLAATIRAHERGLRRPDEAEEIQRLHREIRRLRELLRAAGLDPDAAPPQPG
jgi:hypothetical protein